ncbi:hypothetical protein Tco_1012309 [Tanacetum coccineum]
MEIMYAQLVEARVHIAEMHYCLEQSEIQETENEARIRALRTTFEVSKQRTLESFPHVALFHVVAYWDG